MEIKKLNQNGYKVINKYDSEGFLVSNVRINDSILILYDYVKEFNFDGLNVPVDIVTPLINADPKIDLLIIGHSKGLEFILPNDINLLLKDNYIKIEKMITSSACRTFNLLVGENRKVACLLLI